MKTNLTIGPVSEGDHAAWMPLWLGYQSFYGISIPENVSAFTWGRLLDTSEPMSAALAWVGEEPVGLVHFIYHRSCWTEGDYCYLQDLFVAEESRGSGAGRKLIEHVYADAAHRNCPRVYWLTQESNQQSMLLYDRIAERSGFIQYRKSPPFPEPPAGARE